MNFLKYFQRDEDEERKEARKLLKRTIEELKLIKRDVTDFGINGKLNDDISKVIGELQAIPAKDLTDDKIIEVLVFLSDKTKTNTDTIQAHYVGTIMRIIDAKINVLMTMNKMIMMKNQITSFIRVGTLGTLFFFFFLVVALLVSVDVYRPEFFQHIGITK